MSQTAENKYPVMLVVAGENPDKLVALYDKALKVEPYVIFKYSDRNEVQRLYINDCENQLKYNTKLRDIDREDLEDRIAIAKDTSPEDFYNDYTFDYQHDEETGDALTDENPDGKWVTCNPGQLYSTPFITKDGRTVFSARKCEIDWNKIHLFGKDIHEDTWDLVIENREPITERDQCIKKNMMPYKEMLEDIGSKELYATSHTAFWAYAFLSEDKGWCELGDNENQYEWMAGYYERFIKLLPKTTLLTIYEITR